MKSFLWWPHIENIETLVRSSQSCKCANQAPPKAPLQPCIWPSKPWAWLHIDFAGLFKSSNFLIVVDAHSTCPEIHRMSTTTAYQTINILRSLLACHGIPNQVVSDNGPQFIATEFGEFLQNNGIKHIHCSTYHPSSNGEAERFVRSYEP